MRLRCRAGQKSAARQSSASARGGGRWAQRAPRSGPRRRQDRCGGQVRPTTSVRPAGPGLRSPRPQTTRACGATAGDQSPRLARRDPRRWTVRLAPRRQAAARLPRGAPMPRPGALQQLMQPRFRRPRRPRRRWTCPPDAGATPSPRPLHRPCPQTEQRARPHGGQPRLLVLAGPSRERPCGGPRRACDGGSLTWGASAAHPRCRHCRSQWSPG